MSTPSHNPAAPNHGEPHGPSHGLPHGLTDADLVDLVDGRLPAAREEAVLLALKMDARLAPVVRAMREDRAGLADLGAADARMLKAPADLADRIEARLEVEALRGLAEQAEVSTAGRIPVSSIEIETPGVLARLVESAWARRLSMAAAVVIVAGVGVLGWREAQRSGLVGTGGGVHVAKTPPGGGMGVVAPDAPGGAAPIEVAHDAGRGGVDGAGDAPEAPTAVATSATEPAVPSAAPSAAPALTPERTLALAATRRLAITVYAPPGAGAQAAMKRLDTLARVAGREGGWEAFTPSGTPVELASLLTPTGEVPAVGPAGAPGIAPVVVAGDEPGAAPKAGPGAGATPSLGPAPRPVVRGVYSVQVEPRAGSVEALVKLVQDGLPEGARVVVRELGAALPAPEVALDPESVLWWSAAPSGWSPRASVPIVVETVE